MSPNQQYVCIIILVAMPISPQLENQLKKFGAKISSNAPSIDWASTDTSGLPKISQHLCFARHMAICAVDHSMWTDANLTLAQKFQAAKFWDHNGWDSISTKENLPRRCETWSVDIIRTIESVEILRETLLSDMEVDSVFEELMANWIYGPVWWNCQDFAIRLGYLLTTAASLQLLRNLLLSLRILFDKEIIECRDDTIFGASTTVVVTTVGLAIPIGVASLFFPPAALIAGPVGDVLFFGVLGWFGSGLACGGVDSHSLRCWQGNMRKLGEKFHVLKELHEGLYSDFAER